MAFIGNFNAAEIEPADFGAIPAGEYTALITSSEFRATKSGDGQYLVLTHQIIDGPRKGRMLWHNLNLINNNQQAVEIAQRELSAIARAINVMTFDNSESLHNIPMRITVTYTPAGNDKKGVYREESNKIKKWEALTAGPSTFAPAATPAARPAAAPSPPAAPPRRPAPPPAAPAAVAGKPWGPPAAPPAPAAPQKAPPVAPPSSVFEAAGDIEDDDVPF